MTPIILFTYQYKDHASAKLSTDLGNNRLSYADSNGNGKIDTPGSTAVTLWEETFEDKSKSLLMGLKAGFFSGVTAGVISGVSAGLKATKNGRNFWNNSLPRPEANTVSTLNQNGIEPVGLPEPRGDLNGLRAIEENDLLTNPTGLGIRDDSGGSGYFNAPRGNRLHEGIDFSALAGGQNVVAPDSGTITNFTGRTSGYPMARIVPSNPNAGYDYMEILYIDRPQGVREWVSRTINAGDIIGSSLWRAFVTRVYLK